MQETSSHRPGCCTCLSVVGLKPLLSQENDKKFLRGFRICTGMKITGYNKLSEQICSECIQFIKSVIDFRIKSRKVQNALQGKSKIENGTYNKNTIVCDNESKVIITEGEDHTNGNDKHNQSDHDVSENKNNTKTTIDTKPYLQLVEGSLERRGPIKCKVCKKYSKSVNSFIQHSKSHFGYDILCEFCARRCISRIQLLRHQRAKHGLARDDSFVCSYCKYQALDKEQLLSHERHTHTKERPYVCAECGEAFYTKRVLVQHSYSHKTEKPFQCEMCSSKFKNRSALTNHKNIVHSKKYTYGCYICCKTFNKPYAVRRHLYKLHGIPKVQQDKVQRYSKDR